MWSTMAEEVKIDMTPWRVLANKVFKKELKSADLLNES